MANKYLDNAGLDRMWDKIKAYLGDSYAAKSHTHTIAQIIDLQTKLNGKADSSHTHTASQITDLNSKGFISKGTKVIRGQSGTSYTLPASAIGVLVPCRIYFEEVSTSKKSIIVPSGGEYLISTSGAGSEIRIPNIYSGGTTIATAAAPVVSGFYMRIS